MSRPVPRPVPACRRVPSLPARVLVAAVLLSWAADAVALVPAAGRADPGAHGGSFPPDTVVDGFHGYRFGTPGARIDEIDVTSPPDGRHDGLLVYARDLHFLGVPTRAYFYLDSASRRLRRGKHLIEPDRSSCVRHLTTLRLMVASTHPELEARVRPGAGAGDTTARGRGGTIPVRCPAFVEADSAPSWLVRFRNPETGAVEARMELFRRGGEPRILACYLNEADCAWPDSVEVRPGPRMLAPGRGPDTTGARRQPRRGRRPPRGDPRTPRSDGP